MGLFSTSECSWSQTSVKLMGRTITGLRGFEFKKTVEKEAIYATGSKPIDIQIGNQKCEGHLKMLKYEVDLLNAAAKSAGYLDILNVPHGAITITCVYKKSDKDAPQTINVFGIAFSELSVAMEQNAKMTEVNLPFIASDIVYA